MYVYVYVYLYEFQKYGVDILCRVEYPSPRMYNQDEYKHGKRWMGKWVKRVV